MATPAALALATILGVLGLFVLFSELQKTFEPGSGGGAQMLYFFFMAPGMPFLGVAAAGSATGFAVCLRKLRRRIRDMGKASIGKAI